jgi:hypothetical protein
MFCVDGNVIRRMLNEQVWIRMCFYCQISKYHDFNSALSRCNRQPLRFITDQLQLADPITFADSTPKSDAKTGSVTTRIVCLVLVSQDWLSRINASRAISIDGPQGGPSIAVARAAGAQCLPVKVFSARRKSSAKSIPSLPLPHRASGFR